MLTARFCRLSVHYSVARLMSPPNIHFGSLKDCASAIEVFEAEVISEMQSSHFILGAWQLQEKGAPPLSIFSSSQDLSKMEKKMGKCFMSLVFSCQKWKKTRANESQCGYTDIPREDAAGIKACHFVRDDHKTAPIFYFCFFFPLKDCQDLKGILFLGCPTTGNRCGTLKWNVYN